MKYLIVYADDFGFSPGVNKGCIEAYEDGIVTELSLMVDFPGTNEAVALARQERILDVGVHITLNELNKTGRYLRTADYVNLLASESGEKIAEMVIDELSKFESLLGKSPTHITSHQDSHKHPKVLKPVLGYAKKRDIPIRLAINISGGTGVQGDNTQEVNRTLRENGVSQATYIYEQMVGTYEEVYDGFLEQLKQLKENEVAEFMLHPGYADRQLKRHSSMTVDRERDIKLATDTSFRREIERLGFNIVSYTKLKSVLAK